MVAFEELFEPVKTITLDAAVLISQLRAADVSESGHILVSDDIKAEINLFSESGVHLKTLSASQCSPDAGPLRTAKFLDNGQILAFGSGAYLFTDRGDCIRRVESMPRPPASFCFASDSLYAYYPWRDVPIIKVYDSTFTEAREYVLDRPLMPQLVEVSRGLGGKEIACIGSNVWYVYPNRSDATPVLREDYHRYYKPRLYRAPILSPDWFSNSEEFTRAMSTLYRTANVCLGVYRIDDEMRMVVFNPGPFADEKKPTELLINIVGKKSWAVGYSTMVPHAPLTVESGFLFMKGSSEGLTNGLKNPIIEVFRMKHPKR